MYFSHTRPVILGLCLLATSAALPSQALAAKFGFHKIVDSSMDRPDGLGLFRFTLERIVTPAIDGPKVVFVPGPYGAAADSVWAANINGSGLLKLVGTSTPVPKGVGNFSQLSYVGSPLVKGSTVAFSGSDSSGRGYPDFGGGIYTVPVAGGAVKRVVNYTSPVPGGTGNFSSFGSINTYTGQFSIDGGKVAFQGLDNTISQGGVFVANFNGSKAMPVAVSFGGRHCHNELYVPDIFHLDTFIRPSISGNFVSYYVSGLFDPSTGGNQALAATINSSYSGSTTTGDGCPSLGTSLTPLPGASDPAQYHTRYHGIQTDRGIVVFLADYSQPFDPNYNNYTGLFAVCADGSSSRNKADGTPAKPSCGLPKRKAAEDSPFTLVASNQSNLPGLNTISTNSFAFSLSQGQVLFRAVENPTSDTQEGLYLAKLSNRTITKVIASGDKLDGKQILGFSDPGTGALSGGNLVFSAVFTDRTVGIYSARPCAANVSAKVTVTRGGFRLDAASGHTIQTVTLTNTGGTAIKGPVSLVLRNLSGNAELVNTSGTANCLAAGSPYKKAGLSGNVLGANAGVKVRLEFAKSNNASITYATQIGAGNLP